MTIESFLSTYGTPFGSQVWGGTTPTSDIDYLIPRFKQDDLINLLKKLEIQYTSRSSFYNRAGINQHIEFDNYQVSIPEESAYIHQLNTIQLLNRLHTIKPSLFLSKVHRQHLFESTYEFLRNRGPRPDEYSIAHFPELFL